MACTGLAWLGGVALQLQERALLPSWSYLLCVGLAGVCGWAALRWRRFPAWVLVTAVLSAFALGFGATGWRAAQRLAETLPPSLEGQELQVVGIVASLPQRSAVGLRFRFDIEEARLQGQPVVVPAGVTLGWYVGWHEDGGLSEPQLSLRAGQRWRFTVRLRQPHGNLNPHGFDYELYLFEQGVRATGHVRDKSPPELLQADAGRPVDRLRQRVRDAIDASVPDPRTAGVLSALAVGDQSAIELVTHN